MWHDGIIKVALETLDYGGEFNDMERCDYRIATFKADGTQDFMPGVYELRGKGRKAVRDMATVIAVANNQPCKVGKDVTATDSMNDSEKRGTLEVRKTRNDSLAKANKAQRRKDNGLGR
jgi:hypothetical protein